LITRCVDYRIIKRFLDNHHLITNKVIYLLECDPVPIGLWSFHQDEDGLRIHANMGIDCRGRKAIDSAKRAFEWVFQNTDYPVVYARIEKQEPCARFIARQCMTFLYADDERHHYEIRK